MQKTFMILGIATVACLLWGCGGSGDEGESASVTKAQFIRQAEKVCTKIAKEQEVALVSWRKHFPGGAAEAQEHPEGAVKAVIVPSMQEQAEELGRIPAPKKDEREVSRMTESLFRASMALERKGLDEVSHSVVYAFKRAAFAYGLKTCPIL